ncbi:MAG: Smr/MutS family protein [Alphaproteobacteria bacterium]|nr:Smr/MutS family protein [Alphaproteobacteria bacterium]
MSGKPPDYDLWDEVVKTVKPLAQRHRPRKSPLPSVAVDIPKAAQRISVPHIHVPNNVVHAPPPFTGFDRRTAQRMLRGQVDIDGRIDLHGVGVEMARVKLLQFLTGCQSQGLRTVLVITGKGDSPFARHTLHGTSLFHTQERQGRLRRLVPDWFHEHPFRVVISGYQPAHPKHGGGGALYVKLRRIRERR